MGILFLPPFDVPDALDELALRLHGSVVSWPPAASSMPADQEVVAVPAAQRLLADRVPDLVVGVECAANTAALLAGERGCRLVLIDPVPKLPGVVSDRQAADALDEVLAQVDLTRLSEQMTAAEERAASAEERAEVYLQFLECDVLPLLVDPHQRRQAESRLRVHRRDGVIARLAESRLAPWHRVIREPERSALSMLVLTTQAEHANEQATMYRAAGCTDVRTVPMAQPWWWAAPERAIELIEDIRRGTEFDPEGPAGSGEGE